MVNGKKIRCMAKEYSNGLIIENLEGSTIKIKNKDTENSIGVITNIN